MKKYIVGLLLLCITSVAPADFVGKVIQVYDGDTVTVSNDGLYTKVRLYGIDAPEIRQEYGLDSRLALITLVLGRNITVLDQGRDIYGRTVGIIMFEGRDINLEMIHNGHAWCYREYTKTKEYLVAEIEAHKALLGLWKAEKPVAPWDYRRSLRKQK